MPAQTIYTRLSPAEVRRRLAGLAAALTGAGPRGAELGRGLQLRLGVTALSLVKQRFEVLSRGGSYEGEAWAPLAPATIAGRRRPKGVPTRHQARKLVAAAALKLQRSRKGTKARAAALKAYERAKKLAAAAFAPVQIGVDTGVMRASLSPGVDGPSGHPNQVCRVEPAAVTVGTNVPYARWFHAGTRRQPARPLWPVGGLPRAWHRALGDAASSGTVRVVELLVTGGI